MEIIWPLITGNKHWRSISESLGGNYLMLHRISEVGDILCCWQASNLWMNSCTSLLIPFQYTCYNRFFPGPDHQALTNSGPWHWARILFLICCRAKGTYPLSGFIIWYKESLWHARSEKLNSCIHLFLFKFHGITAVFPSLAYIYSLLIFGHVHS